ncbi:hypothetical protein CHS0354_011896 [Potamilus streckersoni]|uniref:RING-type domain-containing protein n=1 Tax=Potamilus streckersoni TaxID=2493646 RepID=A0AAE0T079_9BIVA|nr:hypothetical protein CHS0354_011896 [Potamilus streckersoni]
MAASYLDNYMYIMKQRCPICLGRFDVQKQLPCLHSFCQGCLEEYIVSKAAKMREMKEFECPICRYVVPIPRKSKSSKKWASLFSRSSVLESIQGNMREVHRYCDCCISDSVSVTARGFCVVCEEAMCETCLHVHKRQKATKKHSIVTNEALLKNSNNFIRLDNGFRCQDHVGEELMFYCKEHKIACCSSCCIIHHRNCNQVLDMRKEAKHLLQDLKPPTVIEEMIKIENHLLNFEKINDSNIINLESQVQEMTNKIKEIRNKVNDILDNLERRVKSEGNQLAREEAIRKQKENQSCQALLKEVGNSHVTLETVMQHVCFEGNNFEQFE